MNSRIALAVATVFALVASVPALAGECSASAEPGRVQVDNGDVYTNFRVSPIACDKGCNGRVEFRVQYKGKNGNDHFYASTAAWRSRRGETVAVAEKGYEGYCSHNSLGPCRVMNLEVKDTTCYDR